MVPFKLKKFNIENEEEIKKIKVSELDDQKQPKIKDFQFISFQDKTSHHQDNYSLVKEKYGSLALTDSERLNRSQKDRKFYLNSFSRNSLLVDNEENRVIEEKVVSRIKVLSEGIKSKGFKEGLEEGLKKGFQEAFNQFKEESSENLRRFDEFIQAVENSKVEIFKANEEFLIELVFRISKLILLKDLEIDKGYILRLAKEMIDRLGVKNNITLLIHPNDASILDLLQNDLKVYYSELKNLTIQSSDQIKQGGCRIETEWNTIDASLENQLQGVYKSLVSSFRKADIEP